jgi:hypothetical protein
MAKKLFGKGIGRGAEELRQLTLEAFGGGGFVRLKTELFERQGYVPAFTFARFFRGPSHTGFSLPWHEGILKQTA